MIAHDYGISKASGRPSVNKKAMVSLPWPLGFVI